MSRTAKSMAQLHCGYVRANSAKWPVTLFCLYSVEMTCFNLSTALTLSVLILFSPTQDDRIIKQNCERASEMHDGIMGGTATIYFKNLFGFFGTLQTRKRSTAAQVRRKSMTCHRCCSLLSDVQSYG